MGYSTTATGHRDTVRRQTSQRVIRQMNLNGWMAIINQVETITEETWVGLTKADAEALCIASESSTIGTVTRGYLGGCTVTNQTPFTATITATSCWGTRVQSQIQRMGDTNMYQVSRTTTVLDVYAPSGSLSKW